MAYQSQSRPGYQSVDSSANPKSHDQSVAPVGLPVVHGQQESTYYTMVDGSAAVKGGQVGPTGLEGRNQLGYTASAEGSFSTKNGNARPGGGSTITTSAAPEN